MIGIDKHIDASGLHCPLPVIMCKAALSRMRPGEVLCVVVTDRASISKLPALIGFLGDEIVDTRADGHVQRILVKRRAISKAQRVHSIRDRFATLLSRLLDYIPSQTLPTG